MTDNQSLDKVRAEEYSNRLGQVLTETEKVIVGQRQMMEGLLLGLITGGHILLEGVPGLAKTLAVSTLARTLDTGFKRIHVTPDLLPADITGTTIYNRDTYRKVKRVMDDRNLFGELYAKMHPHGAA